FSLLGYQLFATLILTPMELAVRRIAAARGEPTRWMSPSCVLLYLIAVPLTQWVYAVALASACRLRRVVWRGIDYEINGPWKIRRGPYFPYQADTHQEPKSL
ncbi:MAG: hypothetical protein MI861_03485, partial [Pirellulales bacterium]|nr:hypothetical protein [Pirellulales bacterium]